MFCTLAQNSSSFGLHQRDQQAPTLLARSLDLPPRLPGADLNNAARQPLLLAHACAVYCCNLLYGQAATRPPPCQLCPAMGITITTQASCPPPRPHCALSSSFRIIFGRGSRARAALSACTPVTLVARMPVHVSINCGIPSGLLALGVFALDCFTKQAHDIYFARFHSFMNILLH